MAGEVCWTCRAVWVRARFPVSPSLAPQRTGRKLSHQVPLRFSTNVFLSSVVSLSSVEKLQKFMVYSHHYSKGIVVY